ncbi:MAG TPA: Mur ligase family protein, partial [Candidatus Paceibacterota bacterium]|nr:Mur ligase family protein [Candidatus Paceibacterota bacterium]
MEQKAQKIHFVGIGGIGMSALAQYFRREGALVTGSDRDPSPKVHDMLVTQGIIVTVGHSSDNVPADTTFVVYSDAVTEGSEGFVERLRARELGIKEKSYFETLGDVSRGKRTIAVAGTHGKTTTTGMLAKILKDAGESPTAIVGSIVKDFGSNYLSGTSDFFVVEACEYKDHLLELSPLVLVITNLEWDHTDWFPSLEALQETFRKAIHRVPADGAIVTDISNPNIASLLTGAKARVVDYTKESSYALQVPGEFNQQNARAAAAAARVVHPVLPDDIIHTALASFQGTWRRFEYKGKTIRGADVYDDYAHHPTAVRETLHALRAKIKGKLIVAFHPHLYSRTKDLLDEFATAFANADKVLVAPIYPAREVDDGSISSEILAERIRATGTVAIALDFEDIQKALDNVEEGDTIMT